MQCVVLDEKQSWNRFLKETPSLHGGLLQSWEWGEFQKAFGRRVFRLAVVDKGKIVCGWQMIEMVAPLGLRYGYIPRPLVHPEQKGVALLVEKSKQLSEKNRMIFLRIDAERDFGLNHFGFQKIQHAIQPQEEFILDIQKSSDELLREMKPKTRYHIRLAQKRGVSVEAKSGEEIFRPHKLKSPHNRSSCFEAFWDLLIRTCTYHHIRPHPQRYYRQMLAVLGREQMAQLYIAVFQEEIVAAIIVAFFNNTATFLHGGRDVHSGNIQASYLLHWRAIQDARELGMRYYNFGGVSTDKRSWEGITRFKRGFSPSTEIVRYAGLWDCPVHTFFYHLYRWMKWR